MTGETFGTSRGGSGSDVGITSVGPIRPAIRAASTTKLPSTSMNRSLREPNDGALSSTTRTRRRPVRDLGKVADQLSERDWSILRSVAEHRYLTVRQIRVLHFGDLPPASGLRTTQRVLARLRQDRILARLTPRIGGYRAGSTTTVHYVDEVGDRLLRRDTGRGGRRRFEPPTQRFLDHQLGIAAARVALVEADQRGELELLACEIEPTVWRDYVSLAGGRLTLKPDLYAETVSPPGSEYLEAAFIEIDMGTETIPTLVKKCREYEAYRRSGTEQDRSGGYFPLVIWSMNATRSQDALKRRAALQKAIDGDRQLAQLRFHVIAPEQFIPLMQKGGKDEANQ